MSGVIKFYGNAHGNENINEIHTEMLNAIAVVFQSKERCCKLKCCCCLKNIATAKKRIIKIDLNCF